MSVFIKTPEHHRARAKMYCINAIFCTAFGTWDAISYTVSGERAFAYCCVIMVLGGLVSLWGMRANQDICNQLVEERNKANDKDPS